MHPARHTQEAEKKESDHREWRSVFSKMTNDEQAAGNVWLIRGGSPIALLTDSAHFVFLYGLASFQ